MILLLFTVITYHHPRLTRRTQIRKTNRLNPSKRIIHQHNLYTHIYPRLTYIIVSPQFLKMKIWNGCHLIHYTSRVLSHLHPSLTRRTRIRKTNRVNPSKRIILQHNLYTHIYPHLTYIIVSPQFLKMKIWNGCYLIHYTNRALSHLHPPSHFRHIHHLIIFRPQFYLRMPLAY